MATPEAHEPEPDSAYRHSARIYDRVYAWKDYRSEARRIHDLVRRYGPPRARTLLDVACGTGSHLRYLTRWYEVTGLDASREMLREARRKLPRVRFVLGTMQEFDRRERFDVITCLFSAIGHVRSERDLRRTIANFARHLAPGGVLLVEPWVTPEEWRTGSFHLGTYGTRERPIVRLHVSLRTGARSRMDMHYLAADRGKVLHWVERHDLTLFDVATQLRAYRAAGLKVRRLASRFSTTRGLYLAVKPDARPRTATVVKSRRPPPRRTSTRRS